MQVWRVHLRVNDSPTRVELIDATSARDALGRAGLMACVLERRGARVQYTCQRDIDAELYVQAIVIEALRKAASR